MPGASHRLEDVIEMALTWFGIVESVADHEAIAL